MLSRIDNWKQFLCVDSELSVLLEEKNRTGRPFGSDDFYAVVEKLTGFAVHPSTTKRENGYPLTHTVAVKYDGNGMRVPNGECLDIINSG